MSDDEFSVKLRIESHIDEVAEVSQKTTQTKKDFKTHSFAGGGFTYRRAYFMDFDGKYYEVTLSIGHNGTVATVYNVGQIKESISPSAKIIAVVGSMPLGEMPSDSSISEDLEKSNTFDENSSEISSTDRSVTIETDSDARFSLALDFYTEKEYNNYGWARANEILTSGENQSAHSMLLRVLKKQATAPRTKYGEYMIAVGDDDIHNKIVYMKGTPEEPIITCVLVIDAHDETTLSEQRREIYAFERRGVQRKAGGLFHIYTRADVGAQHIRQGNGVEKNGYNHRFGAERGAGGRKASRIKEIRFGEDGEVISEERYSLSGYGPREKLAEAFEELAESELERDIVRRYKKRGDKLERLRVERDEAQAIVDSLKGKTSYAARIKREEAQATVRSRDDLIQRANAKLLELENAQPLRELMAYREALVAEELIARYGKRSRGSELKTRANYTHKKVYSRSDAESAFRALSGSEYLPAKIREELANELWQGLNEYIG